jgi:threonine dehydratase
MHRSFAAGVPQSRADVATIATSLGAPFALPFSFALCRAHVDRLVLVEDDEIVDAMGALFREVKLAVEPSAAVAIAALFGPLRDELRGKRVGIIICGTNISAEGFTALLKRADLQTDFQ